MNNKKKVIIILPIIISLLGIVIWYVRSNDNSLEIAETVEAGVESEAVEAEVQEVLSVHEEETDYIWEEESVIDITLKNDAITATSASVKVDNNTVEIVSGGTYRLTGSLSDGQIIVNSDDNGVVQLILDNADIISKTNSPIYVKDAEKTIIILADGSENYLEDGSSYVFDTAEEEEEDEPNSTIFSKDDLSFYGNGSLTIVGNYNDGISSKDGLVIASGNITITAEDDGIRGKDYLIINDGNITIEAGGDGLKSDNEENEDAGFVSVLGGSLDINAGDDGIQGQTNVSVSADVSIITANGSTGTVGSNTSAKGIVAEKSLVIDSGTIVIDSADDAIHSNDKVEINGGDLTISTGDDGVHADTELILNEGTIYISESYEGLESASITINGGTIRLNSSDDGLNCAGGNDGSGMMERGGRPMDNFSEGGDYTLTINGGYIFMNANGDGLDSNGSVVMTDGFVIVSGPTNSGNGPLDYDSSFTISGGTLLAVGSSGMAQATSTTSTQYAMLVNTTSTQTAGTLIHIEDEDGNELITFESPKLFQSVLFSSADIENNGNYTISFGGTHSGTETDGVYSDGTYSGGTEYTTLTTSSVVTTYGSGGMMNPGGGQPGGDMRGF